jgi:ribosomal protein L17
MKALVMTQLLKIKPDYNGSITFISHINFSGDRIPAVECRMNSIEKAIEIRKECGRVRKADKARSNQYVFITNCVTATSRVRVDILSKISMRLNEKKIDSYCINFEPRPMMKVKHERMGWKTFHYVEAVEKFANLLKKEDIQSAHMKAASIREPIEQIFLVLKREETERTAKRDWVGKGKPTGSNAEKIADTVKTV